MITLFENFNKKIKSTCILLEIEDYKHYKSNELISIKFKNFSKILYDKVKDLNDRYLKHFYLPIDIVGFSIEISIIGKNYKLARQISKELYDTIKLYNNNLKVKIGISYGDLILLDNKLHHSGGDVWSKIEHQFDRIDDGIFII